MSGAGRTPKGELGLIAMAAWCGVSVDQLPEEARTNPNDATRQAWERVFAAVAGAWRVRGADVARMVEQLTYVADNGLFDAAENGANVDFAEVAEFIRRLAVERDAGDRNVVRLQRGGDRLCDALRTIAAGCDDPKAVAKAALHRKEPDADGEVVGTPA